MPRKSEDSKAAKEFESDIRKQNPTNTQKPINAGRFPNPPKGRNKVSINHRPRKNADNEEVTFLAETDLLLDQEEEKLLDPETTQDKHNIAENVYKCFKPIVYLLKVLGRWPLTSVCCPDGTREFEWDWRRPVSSFRKQITCRI